MFRVKQSKDVSRGLITAPKVYPEHHPGKGLNSSFSLSFVQMYCWCLVVAT